MPGLKEPHFFGTDLHRTDLPTRTMEEYLSLFTDAREEKRIGEASPSYLYSKRAAMEIKEFAPSASTIIMLRNPVDMMYSLHSIRLYMANENITRFEDALNAEEKRKRGLCLPDRLGIMEDLFYREVTKHTRNVKRYLDVFGRKNVYITIVDDWKRDTAKVFRETLRFLGLTPEFQPVFQGTNQNRRRRSKTLQDFFRNPPRLVRWLSNIAIPPPQRHQLFVSLSHLNTAHKPRSRMDTALRRRLQAEFAPEVEQLSELLNRDLTHWCHDNSLVK